MPPYGFAVVLVLYTLGIFFHYVSDAQKFYTLQANRGLIETGLFTRTRRSGLLFPRIFRPRAARHPVQPSAGAAP